MKKPSAPKLKVAFVYDRVNKFGGAERLLLAMHQAFPEAPLYTLVYDKASAPWSSVFTVIPTFLNAIPFLRRRHEYLAPLAPLAFETLNLDDYDVVVSLTSSDAKAVLTKPRTLHLCYCLTPPRYLWSAPALYQRSASFGRLSFLSGFFLTRLRPFLKRLDLITSSRPDRYLAVSSAVAGRIRRYYRRPSQVLYPPLDPVFSSLPLPPPASRQDYYLAVSRLVPYKRLDLAVKACIKLNKRLIIVGRGQQEKALKILARRYPNIVFAGSVSDAVLIGLYQQARALIFPAHEDFGLVPLEAQACGTPVIAYGRGGALETVVAGSTGLFFRRQTVASLIKAIHRFEASISRYNPAACQANAARFTRDGFIFNFHDKVNSLWKKRLNTPTSSF